MVRLSSGARTIEGGPVLGRTMERSSRPSHPPPASAAHVPRRLAELRARAGAASADALFLARLRVRIPPQLWTGGFSTAHPRTRLEVLNRVDVSDDVSISDYWIEGRPPGHWAREIARYSDVLRVESLAEVSDGSVYRIRYRNPPVVYVYRQLGLPLQFPLRLRNGWIDWEIVGRRSQLDAVLLHARESSTEVRVASIRRRPLRSHLPVLTAPQQELLDHALALGYFAVPRKISLTELARKLGRSKSSISESLSHVERRLLDSVLEASALRP